MSIKFQGSVIMVKDIAVSRRFYEGLLERKVLADFGPVLEYEGGLSIWQVDHAYSILFNKKFDDECAPGGKNMELCFEVNDIHPVWEEVSSKKIPLVHPLQEQPWGQLVFRIYDPDGHIVEIGEAIPVFVARFLSQGMTVQQVAERTSVPEEAVRQIAESIDKT